MNTAPHSELPRSGTARPRAARTTALLLACALFALPLCVAHAQTGWVDRVRTERAETEEKPTPTSKLRGRVVYEDTGRPVRRARVRLLADSDNGESGESLAALTNARGEFVCEHVPPGKYYAVVEGPGLLTPYSFLNVEDTLGDNFEFNAFRDQFERISVEGNAETHVVVRARRGGALTGKITYENGDPAINVTVTLLRWQQGRLRQYLGGVGSGPAGAIQTDDRGVYRFAGLPPGDYLVSVAEQIEHGNGKTAAEYADEGETPDQPGSPLVVTYYPAATRPADAETIKLAAGEEHAGLDITLAERGLYTLGGVVRDRRTGRPVANVHLGIHLKESEAEEMPLTIDHNTQTDEQGRWAFNEVPDGLYVLSVQPQPESDPAADQAFQNAMRAAVEARDENAMRSLRPPEPVQRFAAKQQDVTIKGQDVANLVVEVSAGAHISGSVVIEGDKELPEYMSIYTEVAGDAQHTPAIGPSASLQDGGRFVLGGIPPGKVYIHFNSSSRDDVRYYVKAINANGTTYTREPLTVEEGTVLKGVRVVLAADMAGARGHVVGPAPDNAPVRGATVVLVPADARQWHSFALQQQARTDAAGAYEIAAPPGDYLLLVLPRGERPRALLEAEIKHFSAGGRRVTLRAGKTEQVELSAPGN